MDHARPDLEARDLQAQTADTGLPGGWHSVWAPEGEANTTPTYVWVHGETPLG